MTLRFTAGIAGIDELRSELQSIPPTLFKESKLIFADTGFRAQTAVIRGIGSGPLYRRTGALARSIRTETTGTDLSTLSTSVFSQNPGGDKSVVYAPVHELGDTIRAKDKYLRVPGGPYLNIPLDANKTAAGVTRRSARTAFAEGATLLRSKRGNWLVVDQRATKRGTKIVPLFALVKQVTIPARLGMRDTVSDFVPLMLERLRTVRIMDTE